MILLFAGQAELRDQIGRCCTEFPLHVAETWRSAESHLASASCLIVAAENLADGHMRLTIARLRNRRVVCPVLVVTRFSRANARILASLTVDEVIWIDDGLHSLNEVVSGLGRWWGLAAIVRAVGTTPELTPRLADVLELALRANPPVLTVYELARVAKCHRATLAREWRAAVGKEHSHRLGDIVHWILLVRALGYRDEYTSWRRAAQAVGTTEASLRRIARRLGVSLPLLRTKRSALMAHATVFFPAGSATFHESATF